MRIRARRAACGQRRQAAAEAGSARRERLPASVRAKKSPPPVAADGLSVPENEGENRHHKCARACTGGMTRKGDFALSSEIRVSSPSDTIVGHGEVAEWLKAAPC
jgi:hypothetical protein